MSGNPVAGKLDIFASTLFSYVYAPVGEADVVLKAHELWCDGKQVDVCPYGDNAALEREAAVYKKLGDHPRITKLLGLEYVAPGVPVLRLERSRIGAVRKYIRDHQSAPLPRGTRLQMALDLAEGLAYAHEKGVRCDDISARNALLFDDFRVKLCDFGAAVLDGDERGNSSYEDRYRLPPRGRQQSELPRIAEDLFALGSSIFEVTEWKLPHQDVDEDEVEVLMVQDILPETSTDNPAASII
jgi:serine/threonine protein kinase